MTSKSLTVPLQRRWDDRFVHDLAMTLEGSGSTVANLLKEYDFSQDDLVAFSQEPIFAQRVDYWRNQLKNNGQGAVFKLKAMAQAELLLDTSWNVIHTDDVSPAVKADLIKWTAKMAGYEPTKETSTGDTGVRINIIMGDAVNAPPAGMRTIEHE